MSVFLMEHHTTDRIHVDHIPVQSGTLMITKLGFVLFFSQLLFDFLAFKNDISFWKQKKSMVGMSSKAGREPGRQTYDVVEPAQAFHS